MKYSRKPNLLYIITEMPVGGAQEYLLTLIKELKSNYKITLLTSKGELIKEAKKYVKVVTIPFLKRPISIYYDFLALIEITKFLKKNNFDIVHTMSSKAGFIGRIAARLANVKAIVHTVHGFPFDPQMSILKKKFFIFLEKIASLCCDKIITVAEWNRITGIKYHVAPASKFITIYNPIDIKKFPESTSFIKQKARQILNNIMLSRGLNISITNFDFLIGTVFRLDHCKAPFDLLEIAKLIHVTHKNVGFILVGDGPLQEQVKSQILKENMEKYVILTYNIRNIPDILPAFDIFILTSLWESLSRALSEAMICGLACISTNVNGIPEILIHNQTGLLNSPGDISKAVNHIIYLLNNPKVRQKLGKNARIAATGLFAKERIIPKIDCLYKNLLYNNQRHAYKEI